MDTGSLNETDRQRGIAHYLEHMAFNGSEHFPPGSVIPFFQSLGMQFGRDQNAFTNMHETSFQLSLPDNTTEVIGKGLSFFSDVVGRLSLPPTEIDNERQIIQEERRRSLGGNERTGRYVIEHIAPGSIFGLRVPIGTEQTINSVNQADFKDYYGHWYGASNATLIVVGDIKPEDVIPVIKDKFADLPKKEKPKKQDVGIKAQDKPYGIVASDPEITSAQLEIARIDVPRGPTTTVPQLRIDLVESLSEACFNTRMSDKVSRGGNAFLNVSAGMGEDSNAIRQSGLSIGCEPSKWKDALTAGTMELQRARKFGFTQHELEEAKKRMTTSAERAVKTEATTPSRGLIHVINGEVGLGEPIMSAQQRLHLLEELLPSITVEEVSAYFAKEMDLKNAAFIAILPSTADVPTEPKFLELGLEALKVDPKPEAEIKTASKLMDELPKPGTVTESATHEGTGVWSGWLSNNVRVHHKFMDQRKDQVTVSIALIGGEMLETAENRGITSAAALPLGREHATSKLSSVDIRELMNGKNVVVGGGGGFGGRGGGSGGSDGLHLAVSGSPEDLEVGMQLAYLLLTDAKIEDAAFTQWKTREIERLEAMVKTAQGYGVRAAASIVYPKNEAKTQPVTVEAIQKIDKAAAQAWLNKLLATSPIEVTIVGDMPREKAIELAAKYLGSLPTRERVSENSFMSQRRMDRPKGTHRVEETIKSDTPQAFVVVGFYGADEKNLGDVRALNMAARILSTRMIDEVRVKAQLVYSIGTNSSPATIFPGFGFVQAGATTDPEKVSALVAKLSEMYGTFAKGGCTDEELTTAKGQMAKLYEEQMIEPAFWLSRLEGIDFRGRSLDDIMATPAAMQALTADQIKAAFAKYYSPDSLFVVAIKPEKSADAKGDEKGAGAAPAGK
jgi:zinc protease